MIYECFYFWDELDLLDAKLHELYDVVDKFVLLEFPTSLRHIPQPLQYNDNKKRFSQFKDKIIHVIGTDENKELYGLGLLFKRHNQYMRGLVGCNPDDIVVLSSPDVVYKRSTMEQLKTINMATSSTQLICEWYCYYMDFFYTRASYAFDGAFLYKNLKFHNPNNKVLVPTGAVITNAGWHFSHLGGIDKVLANLHGHPHTELDNDITRNRELMIKKMENGYEWGASENYQKFMEYRPYKPENYPAYINEHPEIYSKYFRNKE